MYSIWFQCRVKVTVLKFLISKKCFIQNNTLFHFLDFYQRNCNLCTVPFLALAEKCSVRIKIREFSWEIEFSFECCKISHDSFFFFFIIIFCNVRKLLNIYQMCMHIQGVLLSDRQILRGDSRHDDKLY